MEIFSAMAIQGIVGRSEPDYSAALVDSRVAAEALADLRDRSVTRQSMLLRLLRDPAQFRDETLELIAACETTFFGSRWKGYEARLGPAAKELAPRLHNEGLAQMLVSPPSGTPLFNETQQVAIDKLQNAFVIGQGRSFHLVPSLLTQPHVIVKHDSRYAIQDESLASAECRSYGLNLPIVVQFPSPKSGQIGPRLPRFKNAWLPSPMQADWTSAATSSTSHARLPKLLDELG
nr:DUF5937 family protein [Arthrobacter psychrolactophilus]